MLNEQYRVEPQILVPLKMNPLHPKRKSIAFGDCGWIAHNPPAFQLLLSRTMWLRQRSLCIKEEPENIGDDLDQMLIGLGREIGRGGLMLIGSGREMG